MKIQFLSFVLVPFEYNALQRVFGCKNRLQFFNNLQQITLETREMLRS